MALPLVPVNSLAALQAVADVLDPRELLVDRIDAVRHAPDYLALVMQKAVAGWICGQEARIRKVSRFALILIEIDGIVLPALNFNPENMNMVRRLGSCGIAIRRLTARSIYHTPAALAVLARPFSAMPIAAARVALKGDQQGFLDRLQPIAVQLQACLDATIELEALPAARVRSLADVHAIGAIEEPRHLQILALNAVRDAPVYLTAVLEKKALGWTCDQEAVLQKIARVATLLVEVEDTLFPKLQADPLDWATLRRLRSRGDALNAVKRHIPGDLRLLTVPLSNRIRAAPASLLRGEHSVDPIGWLQDRLDQIRPEIHACMDFNVELIDDDDDEEEEDMM